MKVSLKDIAKAAGVSLTAASLAINNKKGVNPDKAAMIRKIAVDMGYGKASPPLNKSGEVILFVQFNTNVSDNNYKTFIADYYNILAKLTSQYSMKLETKIFQNSDLDSVLESLNKEKACGIIFLGAGLYKKDINILNKCIIPSVFIDVHYGACDADFIDMDNFDSVEKILQYIINKNYKNIGFVQSHEKTPNFFLREKAFYNSLLLEENDIKISDKITISSSSSGKDEFIEAYKALEIKPEVVFCVNDIIAYNVIQACYDMNLKMPEDIGIIGFDDLPTSSILVPQLTTINISRKEIVRNAVNKLIDKIDNPEVNINSSILIKGSLIIRKSCL